MLSERGVVVGEWWYRSFELDFDPAGQLTAAREIKGDGS